MRSGTKGIPLLGLACLLVAIATPVISQTTTGRILGTVSDQSGAAVTGAAVVITDVQRGTTRAAVTDASGDYTVPEVQPGLYKVRAEARGFKIVARENNVVEVAQDVGVDLSLPAGQVPE